MVSSKELHDVVLVGLPWFPATGATIILAVSRPRVRDIKVVHAPHHPPPPSSSSSTFMFPIGEEMRDAVQVNLSSSMRHMSWNSINFGRIVFVNTDNCNGGKDVEYKVLLTRERLMMTGEWMMTL